MGRGARHAKRRLGTTAIALVAFAGVIVAAVGGTSFAAYRYDRAQADRVLPGVRINGVDVGGMTRQEAIDAVTRVAGSPLTKRIVVSARGWTWKRSLSDLGLVADVGGTVDRAMNVSDSYSWVSRAYHRIASKPVPASFRVPYRVDTKVVSAFVDKVAGSVGVAPSDASFALVDGEVQQVHAKPGLALKKGRSLTLLAAALNAHRGSVKLPMDPVAPAVGDDDLGRTIVVNVTKNMLYLYDGFEVIRSYQVATARQGFLTPTGAFTVIAKAENPTWHNPAPDGWGAGEPLVIPPGPNNPLGTRALYLDAPGIRIHGSPASSSIGTYASHGCIRMRIPESEALYPLVPVGTPVFVIGAPPWGTTTDPGIAG